MWQQKTSYEQSNVLDVTIQCQFNIAAKNVAEYSTMFAHPNQTRQPTNQPSTHCQTYYSNGQNTPTRSQCDFEGYPQPIDYRGFRSTNQTGAPRNSHDPTNIECTSSPKFHQSTSRFSTNHVSKPDHFNMNQFLDDSGYNSPSINHHRQLPVPLTSFASSSPLYSQTAEDFSKLRDITPQQSLFQNTNSDSYVDQWFYSQCNYGYNQCQIRPEVTNSSPVRNETDDTCEDMKLALREKDISHRLFLAMETNKDAADEVEHYYQSQTSMIDLERHNVLCQRAYDRESTASINTYYNRKLVTLLGSVEHKLSAIESDNKSKPGTGKRCVMNQKKGRLLPKHAVNILESWYQENLENPYPVRDVTLSMASEGGITVEQIRKWFANKRNRSRNSKLKKSLLEDCE